MQLNTKLSKTNRHFTSKHSTTKHSTSKYSKKDSKKSKKSKKYKTTISNKFNKYNTNTIHTAQNISLGNQIINCYIKSKSIENTEQNLKKLIIDTIDNEKFNKYEKDLIPFNKDIQGNSGAIVGYLKSDPKTVLKIHYYDNKSSKHNYDLFFKTNTCLQINNKLNEILTNNILNNLDLLNIFTKIQLDKIKPYILELKDSGFSDKGVYILLPLVGFEYKISSKSSKYVSNLTDIIVLNHKVLLDKAINTHNFSIIELYDDYLSLMLTKYFDILYLLQDKLDYINTDLKLNNVFVSRKINKTPKFKKLKSYGFDIDFQLIISDLEKSIYKINNIKTITIPNNPLKVKVADKLGYGLIYQIRYQCISDFEKLCPKLKRLDYDILFMIINLLVILHRNNSFSKMKNHLKKTLQLMQKTLKLNNNELEIFLKIINNNIFTKDIKVQYYLNLLISEMCKKL